MGRAPAPDRGAKVVVLGAGPAGCAAALGIARLGHEVLLVGRPRRFPAWEGLAPRAVEGLAAAGLAGALAAVGPEVAREAHWAGEVARRNRERVVERRALDEALLAEVAGAGVRVLAGRAGRARETGRGVRVEVSLPGGARETVEADLGIEARGREAPRQGRRPRSGPPTVALARAWRGPADRPARTAVASFRAGWAWYAADRGRSSLQILVDGPRGALPGRGALIALYDRLRAEVAPAREWLGGARAVGPVIARAASMVLTAPVAEGRWLRIGDAGLAIDPLSGHGVHEALGSALAAAPVANTLLARPADGALARAFLEERAGHGFWRGARVGRDFYRAERRWAGEAFWRTRAAFPDDLPAHPPERAGDLPRIERRPVIDGGLVAEREVVVTPDHPRGVWRVGGVALVAALPALRAEGGDVARAAARLGADPAGVALAAAWLRRRGLL